jgi:hypothetical protein
MCQNLGAWLKERRLSIACPFASWSADLEICQRRRDFLLVRIEGGGVQKIVVPEVVYERVRFLWFAIIWLWS